jgi:hypothetical protein
MPPEAGGGLLGQEIDSVFFDELDVFPHDHDVSSHRL